MEACYDGGTVRILVKILTVPFFGENIYDLPFLAKIFMTDGGSSTDETTQYQPLYRWNRYCRVSTLFIFFPRYFLGDGVVYMVS